MLISTYGINTSFLILGIAVIIIAVPLAFTINNPPADYVPEAPKGYDATNKSTKIVDINWRGMLKTPQFYSLWVMYAFASAAGLMIIGNITSIAATQANITDAAYLVVILAIFNSGGRVVAGILSDKIGGVKTLMLAFIMQGINMVMFASFKTDFTLTIGAAVAGVGYGTLRAVFPSIIADFYGLKNYGVLYTAWGVSGFIGPVVAAFAVDTTGTYTLAYAVCSVMIAVILSFITKKVDAEALEKKLAST